MSANAIRTLTFLLFLPLAFGQPTQERVFHFQPSNTTQDIQEIATAIRGIGDISDLSIDTGQRILTLRGTAGQVGLSEWLFPALDNANGQGQDSSPKEYRISLSGDDVVAIFHVKNATTLLQLQDIASAVRPTAGIRRLFIYNALRVVVARGTPAQIALAGWLFLRMDKPAVRAGETQSESSDQDEYRNPAGGDDVTRVFYLRSTPTVQDFQELVTLIRTITEIWLAFTYSAPRAFVVRGPADQIALAEWLSNQLDRPADRGPDTAVHEYKMAARRDDVVQVFYLDPSEAVTVFHDRAAEMSAKIHLRLALTYNRQRAVAVRGTANEIAWADQLLKAK